MLIKHKNGQKTVIKNTKFLCCFLTSTHLDSISFSTMRRFYLFFFFLSSLFRVVLTQIDDVMELLLFNWPIRHLKSWSISSFAIILLFRCQQWFSIIRKKERLFN